MNAVSRTSSSSRLVGSFASISISRSNLLTLMLLILVSISAFCVIYLRDTNRQLVDELHRQQYQEVQLKLEHNQLLVERSALSSEERVAAIAKSKLNMQMPESTAVVMVRT